MSNVVHNNFTLKKIVTATTFVMFSSCVFAAVPNDQVITASIVNNQLTASYSATLLPQESYGVRIDGGAIRDMANNAYLGLAETALSFTTANVVPTSGDDIANVAEDGSVLIDVQPMTTIAKGCCNRAARRLKLRRCTVKLVLILAMV